MANQAQYPLINGTGFDFSSIELKLAGQLFSGFKSVKYKRIRTRAEGRGNSPDPLFKTQGENKYSASCELFLADWNYFQQNVLATLAANTGVANSGSGYGDVLFTVTVQYYNYGQDPVTVEIFGCSIDTEDASHSRSADGLTIEISEMSPLKILKNGLDDLGNTLSAAGY